MFSNVLVLRVVFMCYFLHNETLILDNLIDAFYRELNYSMMITNSILKKIFFSFACRVF